MVRTWEIIILVVIGGGGVLILSAIMWAMTTRSPTTIPPLGIPGPAHQSTPAQQSAPVHQSAPAPQGSSEDIEVTSQTQGVIPPVRQSALEDIERSTQTQTEGSNPPAYQAYTEGMD